MYVQNSKTGLINLAAIRKTFLCRQNIHFQLQEPCVIFEYEKMNKVR
jgi:hypothetical protein